VQYKKGLYLKFPSEIVDKPIVYKAVNDDNDRGICWIYNVDKVNCTMGINGTINMEQTNFYVKSPDNNTYPLNVISANEVETTVNGTTYTAIPYSINVEDVANFLQNANNQTVNIYVGENGTTYNCTATFDSQNNTISLSDCPLNQTLYLFEKDGLIWLDDNPTFPTEAVIDVDNINNIMYLLDDGEFVDKVWY